MMKIEKIEPNKMKMKSKGSDLGDHFGQNLKKILPELKKIVQLTLWFQNGIFGF